MATVSVTLKNGSGTAVPNALLIFTPVGHLTATATEYPSSTDVMAQTNGSGVATATLQMGKWRARWSIGSGTTVTETFTITGTTGTVNLTPQGLE